MGEILQRSRISAKTLTRETSKNHLPNGIMCLPRDGAVTIYREGKTVHKSEGTTGWSSICLKTSEEPPLGALT